jgi:hypothetical protein
VATGSSHRIIRSPDCCLFVIEPDVWTYADRRHNTLAWHGLHQTNRSAARAPITRIEHACRQLPRNTPHRQLPLRVWASRHAEWERDTPWYLGRRPRRRGWVQRRKGGSPWHPVFSLGTHRRLDRSDRAHCQVDRLHLRHLRLSSTLTGCQWSLGHPRTSTRRGRSSHSIRGGCGLLAVGRCGRS